ncbi:MAG: glycoside hydrolase family 32 protein [Cytophagaceae bacterium]|nr:glycoside hydrolase family 32 protein [Cytophagaceae bacterium]
MKKYIIGVALALIVLGCKTSGNITKNASSDYRPNLHFSPEKNWANDPNGLVYLDGEYHLFYQYNPFGDLWGHMSWGHAISKDLKKWEELPVAIPEKKNADGTTTMIFSGCAVIDSLNTSGFFDEGYKKGMVAIFTSHVDNKGMGMAQHQSLAYSNDKGRTWKLYEKNPVLDIGLKDFRDPNVIWYPERNVWIMTVVKALEYTVQFYESKDLKSWKLLSEFGNQGDVSRIWECPSLIKVPVIDESKFKWVLMLSSGSKNNNLLGVQYFVGDFDGMKFVPQKQETLFFDSGYDNYATIPFFNLPKSHEKPVYLSWASDWEYARVLPTEGFRGQFTLPREVSLFKDDIGVYRIIQTPIVDSSIPTVISSLKPGDQLESKLMKSNQNLYRLILDFDITNSKGFELLLLKNGDEKTVLNFDSQKNILSIDRRTSGNVGFSEKFPKLNQIEFLPENGKIKLDILVDKSIIEVFANSGKEAITTLVYPTYGSSSIELNWK